MAKVVVMDHPLIQHKIGIMRRKETGSKEFRTLVSEVAMLECYEATRDLELTDVEIETPICKTTVKELKGKKLAVVPILRAGLGMVEGMLEMIPAAKVGHIGLYRDPETAEPVEYYCKLPADCSNREVFVVDPMLATGGSAVAAHCCRLCILYGIFHERTVLPGKMSQHMICQIPSGRFLAHTDFDPHKVLGSCAGNDTLDTIMPTCAAFLAHTDISRCK